MLENIRISFQGIWSHKMRSFLTMLGIIIGIAAIIAIVSTIKGTNEQIKENLIGSGNNTVEVRLYQGEMPYQVEYYGMPDQIRPISDQTFQSILNINHVVSASKYIIRDYFDGIYYQATALDGSRLLGIDSNYLKTAGYRIAKGRPFIQKDYDNFMKVALIDSVAAQSLFAGSDPLGQSLEIRGEPFVIIGVVEKSSDTAPVINNMEDYFNYVGDESSAVYVPLSTWPIINGFDEPESLLVKADATDNMSEVGRAAAKLLNQGDALAATDQAFFGESDFTEENFDENYTDEPAQEKNASAVENTDDAGLSNTLMTDDTATSNTNGGASSGNQIAYKAVDLTEKAKSLQALSESTNKQLLWIASISLLVGGIGVMNIMLVSVTERTQEIGLKKAIGAKKRAIRLQFLTEAAVLTSFGGIIGVISGIIMANIISRLSQSPVSISIPAIIASVLFSMVIGIVFGILPSIKAANLNPIDALRHE